MKNHWKILLGIALCCIVPQGAPAHSVEDLVGGWQGAVEVGKFKIRLRLQFAKTAEGRLRATMDVIDQGVKDIPLAAVLFNDPDVRLEFDQMDAPFSGILDAGGAEIRGVFEDGPGGRPIAVSFNRLSAADLARQAKTYVFKPGEPRDVRGYWKMVLTPTKDMTLRLGFKIGRQADGAFEVLMDSLDQGSRDIPASTATIKDGQLHLEWQAMDITFDARLDESGNQIAGQWKQGGGPALQVTADRLDQPLTALPPGLSFEADSAAPEDPRGYWAGTLDLPGRPLRLKLQIGRAADGAYAALLTSVDQGESQIPATSVTATNGSVRAVWKGIQANFAGNLGSQGRELEGKWEQMGGPMPLKFTRETAPAPPQKTP